MKIYIVYKENGEMKGVIKTFMKEKNAKIYIDYMKEIKDVVYIDEHFH